MSKSAEQPSLFTSFSPALLHLYDLSSSIVVIIDVLRATSTIATALFNGARSVVPADSVEKCIAISKELGGITAGERDGKIAPGLEHGNSPFEYPRNFIEGKTLVLTTTNGTKLLQMAVAEGADTVITGSFANLSAVCTYLLQEKKPVVLACAAWKDRVNLEDSLFAGAVVENISHAFDVNCDSSRLSQVAYRVARPDLFAFLKQENASHFMRLSNYDLEDDIRYCLLADTAPVLPLYKNGKLTTVQ